MSQEFKNVIKGSPFAVTKGVALIANHFDCDLVFHLTQEKLKFSDEYDSIEVDLESKNITFNYSNGSDQADFILLSRIAEDMGFSFKVGRQSDK